MLIDQSCLTLFNPMHCSLPGSSRQEYWSGLPLPFPEDIPEPRNKPKCPALQGMLYYLS